MKKNLIKESVDKKAFTLIEMLIVVLIIGIVAAIALPKYQLARDKSRYSQMLLAAQAILAAQERYYMATGTYTANGADLDISFENVSGGKFIFEWGFCDPKDTNIYVMCSNKKDLKNEYYLGLAKVYIYGGNGQRCYAWTLDKTDRYNKLCQAVSGKKEPDSAGSSYYRYIYP